jgi:hypothetical protein
MITTRSSILAPDVPGYTELQREMHDALRAQHPEWIETDGKAPTCDYYELLFAGLLISHRAHARAHCDRLLNISKTERPNGHEFAKNSRIFAAFTPGANRAPQFFFRRKSSFRNFAGIRYANAAANERTLNP